VMLCEVCIFLHCSNTGIVASNLTWTVDVYVHFYVSVFSCIGRDLGMGLFPTQGVSTNVCGKLHIVIYAMYLLSSLSKYFQHYAPYV